MITIRRVPPAQAETDESDLCPAIGMSRGAVALLFVAAAGFVVRIVLWQVSFGTNDALFWGRIGKAVSDHGLAWAYANDPDCNQPPGQPLWAAAAYRLAVATNVKFPKWFKLPMIIADGVTAWLIWKILRPRRGVLSAAGVVALFAWNPVSILVTSHHANTDSVYAMLSLLAVWLMQDRNRSLLGGLALGAAINVKLIPVLLIAPMFACCRRRDELARLLGGLAIMSMPSMLLILFEPESFTARVLTYTAAPEHWGIGHLLLESREISTMTDWADRTLLGFNDRGKQVLLAAVGALSLVQWWTRRWDRYVLAALTMTLFLVLAPGFCVQYTVAPAALLLVAWPLGGATYAIVGGAYLVVAYAIRWNGEFPIVTIFYREFDFRPGRIFGLLAWATLVLCLARLFATRSCPAGAGGHHGTGGPPHTL